MSNSPPLDLLTAWQANSNSWIQAIEHQELKSRPLATNNAIITAVNAFHPRSILDVGCGEGWLCRALEKPGRRIVGIDGVETLVQAAREKRTNSTYYCYNYKKIRKAGPPAIGSFDVIVFNFSLFEKEGTFPLLNTLHPLLNPGGRLLIQTVALAPEEPSGWHQEDWRSLERNFPAPFAWYYRTVKDWEREFAKSSWKLEALCPTTHPEISSPLSFVLTACA